MESKAFTKNNGKLGQRQAPVSSGHGPFFSNVLRSQVDVFEQGHIGGKGPWTSNQALIWGPFWSLCAPGGENPQWYCRVDDAADGLGVVKIGGEFLPNDYLMRYSCFARS